MLRTVHEERLVGLLYGQRALCIGALAPLNYVGTDEHTVARATPFKRLAHTANISFDAWLTDSARYTGRAIAFEIPMGLHIQSFKRMHDLIMLGSLPPRVRRIYRLRWTPAHAIAVASAVRTLRTVRSAIPRSVACGRNTRSFDQVVELEARRIAQGHPAVVLPYSAP